MPDTNPRELVERRIAAMNARDWDALEPLLHPDYFEDYPQSGERIRGYANVRAALETYPGGLDRGGVADAAEVIGGEDRWVMTPNFSVLKVTGTADVYTVVARATYPDGSRWFVISLTRASEGRLRSATTYFAPEFAAPEWRAHLVEPMPPDARTR